MMTGPIGFIIGHLHKMAPPAGEEATDGQLLEDFIGHCDETAFAALVSRHGPLVLSVCRRVLGNDHDAEDAFQVTFLILARKASAIRKRPSLGGWLYEVAHNVALRAKANMTRRRESERQVPPVQPALPLAESDHQEVCAVLPEELKRLPEKYRMPMVLCYLENKTHEQAAQLLRWPIGTVSGRLARAREMLRKRLERRGWAVSSALLSAVLAQQTATAAAPPILTASTAKAALLVASGQAGTLEISAGAAVLYQEMMRAMTITKLKTLAVLLALASVLGTGSVIAYSALGVSPPVPPNAFVAEPAPAPVPATAVLPPDLDLVPREAFAFVSLRVADLHKALIDKNAQQPVTLSAILDGFLRDPRLQQFEKTAGLGLEKIDRFTLLKDFRHADKEAMIITAAQPYARDNLLQAVFGEAEEVKDGRKTYYFNKKPDATAIYGEPTALYFANERTIVIGHLTCVRELLAQSLPQKQEETLQGALRLAVEHPFVVGVNPQPLNEALKQKGEALPQDYEDLKTILDAKSAALTVNLAKQIEIDLFLNYPNENTRKDAVKDIQSSLAWTRLQAEKLSKLLTDEKFEKLALIAGETAVALKDAPIRQEGLRVHVPVYVQADPAARRAAVLEVATQLLPKARLQAEKTAGMNNLRQLGIAMHIHHDTENKLPPDAIYSKDGKPLLSWRVAILPYLEQDGLYKEFKLDEPWDSEHNKKLLAKMPKIFALPGVKTKEPYTTFYRLCSGKGAVFEGKQQLTLAQITAADGASNTLMILEAGEAVPWTKPEELDFSPDKPLPKLGASAEDYFLALFVDCHVQTIKKKTDEKTIRALVTWDGGEKVDLPQE